MKRPPNRSTSINDNYMDPTTKASSYKRAAERPPSSVARRNARERNRVQTVNQAFLLLRYHLPVLKSKVKRVSKLKILQAAITYMYDLVDVLDGHLSLEQLQASQLCSNLMTTNSSSNKKAPGETGSSKNSTKIKAANHHQNNCGAGVPSSSLTSPHQSSPKSSSSSKPVSSKIHQQSRSQQHDGLKHPPLVAEDFHLSAAPDVHPHQHPSYYQQHHHIFGEPKGIERPLPAAFPPPPLESSVYHPTYHLPDYLYTTRFINPATAAAVGSISTQSNNFHHQQQMTAMNSHSSTNFPFFPSLAQCSQQQQSPTTGICQMYDLYESDPATVKLSKTSSSSHYNLTDALRYSASSHQEVGYHHAAALPTVPALISSSVVAAVGNQSEPITSSQCESRGISISSKGECQNTLYPCGPQENTSAQPQPAVVSLNSSPNRLCMATEEGPPILGRSSCSCYYNVHQQAYFYCPNHDVANNK